MSANIAPEGLNEPWAAYALIDETGSWTVAYVEENEPGYYPTTYDYGDDMQAAKDVAKSINESRGISDSRAMAIAASSMARGE